MMKPEAVKKIGEKFSGKVKKLLQFGVFCGTIIDDEKCGVILWTERFLIYKNFVCTTVTE